MNVDPARAVRAYLNTARRSWSQGHKKGALQACEHALSLRPNDQDVLALIKKIDPHHKMITTPSSFAEPAEPVPKPVEILARFKARMARLVTFGERFIRENGFERALQVLSTVVREDPENLRACELIITAYRRKNGIDGEITAEKMREPLTAIDKTVLEAVTRVSLAAARSAAAVEPPVQSLPSHPPSPLPAEEPTAVKSAAEPPVKPGRIKPVNPNRVADFHVAETGVEKLPAKDQLLEAARAYRDSGELGNAFLCAARLVREDETNTGTCRLLLEIYRQILNYHGEITRKALGRQYSPQEKQVRIADRRLFVISYLQALLPEQRKTTVIKKPGCPICNLIAGPADFRVFSSLEGALKAAGFERPIKQRKVRPALTKKEELLPPVLPEETKTNKAQHVSRGKGLFAKRDFQNAAAAFTEALKLDGNDIEVYCLRHLCAIYERFPFVIGIVFKLDVPKEQRPIALLAKRLRQRIGVIRFIRKKPSMISNDLLEMIRVALATEKGRIEVDEDNYPVSKVGSLVRGGRDFRVFDGFGEARIAAGLDYEPEVIEKIKREIDQELASLAS